MNETSIAVKAKGASATLITKIKGVVNWGSGYVMPSSTWRAIVEAHAFAVLTPPVAKAWHGIEYCGETEYGVWLRNVNKAEVVRHSRAAKWDGSDVFVSQPVYEEMRAKYYPWWQKTGEQVGWDAISPSPLQWAPSGEPRASEMTAYRHHLSSYVLADATPAQAAETRRLALRCDPSMKIFNLVNAKQNK